MQQCARMSCCAYSPNRERRGPMEDNSYYVTNERPSSNTSPVIWQQHSCFVWYYSFISHVGKHFKNLIHLLPDYWVLWNITSASVNVGSAGLSTVTSTHQKWQIDELTAVEIFSGKFTSLHEALGDISYSPATNQQVTIMMLRLTISKEEDEILCFVFIESLQRQGVLQGHLGPSIPILGILLFFCEWQYAKVTGFIWITKGRKSSDKMSGW